MKNRKVLYSVLTIILIAFASANYSLVHYMNKNNLRLDASGFLPYLKFTQKKISDNNLMQTSVNTSLDKIKQKF